MLIIKSIYHSFIKKKKSHIQLSQVFGKKQTARSWNEVLWIIVTYVLFLFPFLYFRPETVPLPISSGMLCCGHKMLHCLPALYLNWNKWHFRYPVAHQAPCILVVSFKCKMTIILEGDSTCLIQWLQCSHKLTKITYSVAMHLSSLMFVIHRYQPTPGNHKKWFHDT